MPIFDRYLLQLFLKVLTVCLVSFFGLYVVIDAFNNIDVLLDAGSKSEGFGGVARVMADYYGLRVLMFFDRGAAVLALIAGLFTLGWMQRTNELTAVMAAGVSRARIVMPLLIAAAVMSILGAANRELLMPRYRERLARDVNDWLGDAPKAVYPRYDNETDIYLGGRAAMVRERKLVDVTFRLPGTLATFGRQLQAGLAWHQPADEQRPAGFLLENVSLPVDIDQIASSYLEGRPVLLTSADTDWLRPGQCFVVTRVDFDQLAGGNSWYAFSSSRQLITALRNPSLDYGADVRRAIHARLVQPALDMTLFLLGLPLVFTHRGRSVFVAAGLCGLVVVGFLLVNLACQALGNNYLLSPAFSAWMPLMIFTPWAYWTASPIWD